MEEEKVITSEARVEPMAAKYPTFALLTLGYALFYTFCLYQNDSGITFPLFTAGTLAYFYRCFRHLNITFKQNSIWYLAAIELLGISTFLTGDGRIIALNKLGIFLLLICFLLHTVYEDKRWDFTKYMGAFFTTIVMAFGCIANPIMDRSVYRKMHGNENKKVRNEQLKYVMLGIAVCIPLALVVILLLAGADAVFGKIIVQLLEAESLLELIGNIIKIAFMAACVFFAAYMLVAYMSRREIKEEIGARKCYEPALAITVAVVLSAIYVVFCGIQIRYLFVGGITGRLTIPSGLTYSQYARSGFFQLLFVCIINLVIVLLGMYRFRESKILKGLLCIITCCTYIMTASSALRMILYIQYKYLTFLRIFVLWALVVIALLFAGVLISIWKKNFPLFRYSVVVVTVCYLLLSFARVDYWIAKVNIDNMEKENQYVFFKGSAEYDDLEFLSKRLGPDAAPVIMTSDAREAYGDFDEQEYQAKSGEYEFYGREYYYDEYEDGETQWKAYLQENWRSIYMNRMEEMTKDMGIRDFNLSRYLAHIDR